MAEIISEETGKTIKVKDGETIKEACKELEVPFACEDGICGSCMIDIVGGENNLTDLTENEKYMARDIKHRLACQCKIKEGTVKIKF